VGEILVRAVLHLAFIAILGYTNWLDLSRDKVSLMGRYPRERGGGARGSRREIVAPTLRSARADVVASLPRHGGVKPPLRLADLKVSAPSAGRLAQCEPSSAIHVTDRARRYSFYANLWTPF